LPHPLSQIVRSFLKQLAGQVLRMDHLSLVLLVAQAGNAIE
jgi:hypothetical protein